MVTPTEVERRLERFRAACKQAGVKLTYQRLEIFRELASRLDHPDAEQLFAAVHERMPTVSLDTVYRTLALLTDLGVVSPLGPRRESVRFDANPARHHHYVCLGCGLTLDFESRALDALRVPAPLRSVGSVSTVQVEVRGLCAGCTNRSSTAGAPRNTPNGRTRRRTT
jgi:Fur family transcriptional regulator, peroxide stress response regulator